MSSTFSSTINLEDILEEFSGSGDFVHLDEFIHGLQNKVQKKITNEQSTPNRNISSINKVYKYLHTQTNPTLWDDEDYGPSGSHSGSGGSGHFANDKSSEDFEFSASNLTVATTVKSYIKDPFGEEYYYSENYDSETESEEFPERYTESLKNANRTEEHLHDTDLKFIQNDNFNNSDKNISGSIENSTTEESLEKYGISLATTIKSEVKDPFGEEYYPEYDDSEAESEESPERYTNKTKTTETISDDFQDISNHTTSFAVTSTETSVTTENDFYSTTDGLFEINQDASKTAEIITTDSSTTEKIIPHVTYDKESETSTDTSTVLKDMEPTVIVKSGQNFKTTDKEHPSNVINSTTIIILIAIAILSATIVIFVIIRGLRRNRFYYIHNEPSTLLNNDIHREIYV